MKLEIPNNSDLIKNKMTLPRPVVLVLLDAWGIAPLNPGNVFLNLKLKTFSALIKSYPTALLISDKKNSAERYSSLGAAGLLSERLSSVGLTQLNLSESEKVILTWHHFNGGREKLLKGEEVKVISSKIGDRKNNPEQVLPEIIKIALRDIKKGLHDFLIISLSNLDLISATGNLESAQKAAEYLDKDLGRLVDAVLKQKGLLIISATYGHAEAMINMATELPTLGITDNPVPFIIVGSEYEGKTIGLTDTLGNDLNLIKPVGTLEDVTPTILKILNITPPANMLGESLL